jgi:hypothetical protein
LSKKVRTFVFILIDEKRFVKPCSIDLYQFQRWQVNIEGGAGAEEDGVRLLHFGGGEEAKAFVEAEVEMLRLGHRERNEVVPDGIAAQTAV